MFSTFHSNSYEFLDRKYYKINDVLECYQDAKENNFINSIFFPQKNDYLSWLLNLHTEDFRCSICGCKANHFRLFKDGRFGLFGIKKLNKNDAIYVYFNRDHILPKSLGGTSCKNNIRLTCEYCNSLRGNERKFNSIYSDKICENNQKLQLAEQFARYMNILLKNLPDEHHRLIKLLKKYTIYHLDEITEDILNNEKNINFKEIIINN